MTIKLLGQAPTASPEAVRDRFRGRVPLVALLMAAGENSGVVNHQRARLRAVRLQSLLLQAGISVYAPGIEYDALEGFVADRDMRRLQFAHLARCDAAVAVAKPDGMFVSAAQEMMGVARAMGLPIYICPSNPSWLENLDPASVTPQEGVILTDLIRSLRGLGFEVTTVRDQEDGDATAQQSQPTNPPNAGRGAGYPSGRGDAPDQGSRPVHQGYPDREATGGDYNI